MATNQLQSYTFELSKIDKHVEYFVISNAQSIMSSNVDQFTITGENLLFEPNIPITDQLRAMLDVVIENHYHQAFAHFFFESVVVAAWIWDNYQLSNINRALVSDSLVFKQRTLRFVGINTTDKVERNRKVILLRKELSLNTNADEFFFKNILDWFAARYVTLYQPILTPVVFMPRQSKENMQGNDRVLEYYGFDELISKIEGFRVIRTDELLTFESQAEAVWSARFLVVPDGSAFLVNGFFCRQKTIVVLGSSLVPNQSRIYSKYKILLDSIRSRNHVVFIRSDDHKFYANDLIPILKNTYSF